MKDLKNYITETVHKNIINEAKEYPFIKKEIKTKNGEFENGDIVLFKELLDKGDEKAVMVVTEAKGDRCDVATISAPMAFGFPVQCLSTSYLFKIGETTVTRHPGRGGFDIDIQTALDECEKVGLDITDMKEKLIKIKRF